MFAEAGIKQVINGPFTFSPDGNPLLGPIRGLPGYWTACAVMAGLSQGGGVGLALANWMTDGDPGFDIWGMDVARYGDFATLPYTNEKVRENYSRRFRITFPNEFLPAGRNIQTSPIFDRLVAENAVMGDGFGLEAPLWFQKAGEEPVEDVTFGRSNAWDQVREETLAVRASVGMWETTGFSKFRFSGTGARAYLDRLLAGRIPNPGRMALTPMTNPAGNLIGDLTVATLGAATGAAEGPASTITGGATGNTRDGEEFVLFGSGHRRAVLRAMVRPAPARRRFGPLRNTRLRDGRPVDRRPERTSGAREAHRRRRQPERHALHGVHGDQHRARPVWCGRVTFTGDLGYEFWMPARYQRYVYEQLLEAGEKFGIRMFGLHALNSLRLEKGFGSWAREYRPIYDPFEANLGRFIQMDKDFIGRDALAAKYADDGPGASLALVTFTVESDLVVRVST